MATISGRMHNVREPRGWHGSYSKGNSQISLCMENQKASPAQVVSVTMFSPAWVTQAQLTSAVCISRPDANDFVSQNAVPTGRGVRCVTRLPAVRHPLPGRRGRVSAVTWLLCPLPLCALAPAPAVLSASGPFHPKDKFPPSLVLSSSS